MTKRLFSQIILVVCILIAAFILRQYLNTKASSSVGDEMPDRKAKNYAAMVDEDNVLLQYFEDTYPEHQVLLACEEDLTNDGLKDLVVIFRDMEKTRLTVICDMGSGVYTLTEEIPAPIENQRVQFMDIDKEAEMEFAISGEKDGAVGYAIYRIMDGKIIDLFGQGMEDCC